MIPRSVVQNNSSSLVSVLQNILAANYIFVGVSLNVDGKNTTNISVNPYWRETIICGVLGAGYDYQNYSANLQAQSRMTDDFIPQLAALTPNGAAYLNEADFQQPNWQYTFYRDNYAALDSIKEKYDLQDVFYALGAVGSDRWAESGDGRLCKT